MHKQELPPPAVLLESRKILLDTLLSLQKDIDSKVEETKKSVEVNFLHHTKKDWDELTLIRSAIERCKDVRRSLKNMNFIFGRNYHVVSIDMKNKKVNKIV